MLKRNKIGKPLLLIICFFMMFSCKQTSNENNNNELVVAIVPQPNSLKVENGNFTLSKETKILLSLENSQMKANAEFLKNFISETFGITVSIENGAAEENYVKMELLSDSTSEEAYNLTVTSSGIQLSASTPKGIFYAIQSLIQLMPSVKEIREDIKIQNVTIVDSPRYQWRGMHLDVCRHFYSKEFVMKMIDVMAMHKLNVFHWHLTDDQGWRIEIKKYPKLTEISSWRSETLVGHAANYPETFDGAKHGGFYTQDEIKEVIAYAAERYITIVPEIELPGHAQAALAAYPELSCTGGPFEVWNKWGVTPEVFCAGKEETFVFLEDILAEVCELFPSEYIHIGGDECPKTRWKECADCQSRMKKEGLANENELQSYVVKRIETFLASKGKKTIGWDEILEGGLPENAAIMSWRGTEGGIAAAKAGHNVVMTPGDFCYLDHYQATAGEPLAIGGLTTLKDVYSFEPTPEELTPEEAKFIIGAQANVWTEYILTEEHVEYMVYPRLSAMAEVLWTNETNKNEADFLTRMNEHYLRLARADVNFRVPIPQGFDAVNIINASETEVTLTSDATLAEIRYTTDGSEPNQNSILYEKPIKISLEKDVVLKARVVLKDGNMSRVVEGVFKKAVFAEPTILENPKNGLLFNYYEGEFSSAETISGNAVESGVVENVKLNDNYKDNFFAVQFSGFVNIPEDGIYTFSTNSDDGSVLYINNSLVVDNDGFHYGETRYGTIALKKGYHAFNVAFFQGQYGGYITVAVKSDKMEEMEIPANMLFHN